MRKDKSCGCIEIDGRYCPKLDPLLEDAKINGVLKKIVYLCNKLAKVPAPANIVINSIFCGK